MIKAFLFLALVALFVPAENDTNFIISKFEEEWRGTKGIIVSLIFENNNLVFNLFHPSITTEGIQTLLFLKKDNSKSFIQAFRPIMTKTIMNQSPSPTLNGLLYQKYTQVIPYSDFESVSKFPCSRDLSVIYCKGTFSDYRRI
jgi:hypothetical protein